MIAEDRKLAEYAQPINDYIAAMGGREDMRSVLSFQIPHLMIARPFDKKLRRVELTLRDESHALFFHNILPVIKATQKGFRPLLGQAPRTQLERALQQFLERHAEQDDE